MNRAFELALHVVQARQELRRARFLRRKYCYLEKATQSHCAKLEQLARELNIQIVDLKPNTKS